MDVKLLHDIGLTDGETKVYLALISLGTTKTGPLASKAGVSSSKVYKILDRLEKDVFDTGLSITRREEATFYVLKMYMARSSNL